jgi:glycine C-acetyltransferase
VLKLIQGSTELRKRLWENTAWLREHLATAGFEVVPGTHPIVPVMIGDALKATRLAERLLEKGIYVIAFSFPVVPREKARIRVQVSAAHSREDLAKAVAAFEEAKGELG